MSFPIPKRPAPDNLNKVRLNMGADFARSVADELALTVGATLRTLSTGDKNRVLLALAAFVGAQLEALETNNEPEDLTGL